ncbi:MAG: RNA methyltransferase [Muribaculaceae bacterium]|nr:RNA methyltransferase [Muribaculaceae bacterium]
MASTFQMVAKTFQGLEDVLRDELLSLGAENVEIGRRMVSFEGDLAMMYKANLCCRTALRILKPIIKFSASNPDELYDAVRDIEWEKYMSADSTFSIDSTVNSADFNHSKYVTYRVKDGIADHFTDRYGKRPSIRLKGAEVQLNVHIFEDRVTISLDSSGEPLSKRGYRVEQTAAPINEVLAAGIILKTGWRGDCEFIDPMCGSGTFLIEAALIATNTNPGIYRDSFAFEKWPDFDPQLFDEIYNDDSEECEAPFKIKGGDIDPEAVAIARKNIRSARLDDAIEIRCCSMGDWHELGEEGILVMNPPYGERLRPEDMETLYRNIGRWLKTDFKGWHAWILGYKEEHFDAIHLKPSVKFPILNGALECSLREYVLFDGTYDSFRADGGSVANTEFEKVAPGKTKHLSDREWIKERRKFDGGNENFRKNKKRPEFDDSRDFTDRKGYERRTNDKKTGDRKFSDKKGNDKRFSNRTNGERNFKTSPARQIHDGKPTISEKNEYKFSDYKMRSRKGWRKNKEE